MVFLKLLIVVFSPDIFMFGDIACFFGHFDELGLGFKDILYLGVAVTVITLRKPAGGSQARRAYLACQREDTQLLFAWSTYRFFSITLRM